MSAARSFTRAAAVALSLAGALLVAAPARPTRGDGPALPTDALVRDALERSLRFFDANRSGPDAGVDNAFPWRGACFAKDGEAVGRDLSGGFHDAGDHVKFGLPQSTSAASLAWTYLRFGDALRGAGQDRLLPTLRRFAEYLMKTVASAALVYHQVGDPDLDHATWGRPEDQEALPPRKGGRPRPVFADTGADVAGATAAHLALASLIFAERDPTLARRCLQKAREAFDYADAHRATTKGRGAFGRGEYYPSSDWRDDLALGGAALHLATKEARYLEAALGCDLPLDATTPLNWDSVHALAYDALYEATGKEAYRTALERAAKSHMGAVKANGLAFYHDHAWGTLRYATGMALAVGLAAKRSGGDDRRAFVRGQVAYLLGRNEFETTFLVGVGERSPRHPHHRAAHTPPGDGRDRMLHELTGAMVGGPEHVGAGVFEWHDEVGRYVSSEVAIDFQANCVGALAAHVSLEAEAARAAGGK